MKQFRFLAMYLMALCVIGAFCACGDDDDDNGGETVVGTGSGYAKMGGNQSTFKYAYFAHDEGSSDYLIFFMGRPWMDIFQNPKESDAGFTLYFLSNNNPDFKNMTINTIAEGTFSSGIGFEYQPYDVGKDTDESPFCYISGMASNLEKTTVTVVKTGTNRYRFEAKDQVYLVQEDGHGVWYNGNKPGVRTVVGDFEWEGPIIDARSVIPEEYWNEDD